MLTEGGKPNAKKAFDMLKRAAEDELCMEALRELGYIYEKGGT